MADIDMHMFAPTGYPCAPHASLSQSAGGLHSCQSLQMPAPGGKPQRHGRVALAQVPHSSDCGNRNSHVAVGSLDAPKAQPKSEAWMYTLASAWWLVQHCLQSAGPVREYNWSATLACQSLANNQGRMPLPPIPFFNLHSHRLNGLQLVLQCCVQDAFS